MAEARLRGPPTTEKQRTCPVGRTQEMPDMPVESPVVLPVRAGKGKCRAVCGTYFRRVRPENGMFPGYAAWRANGREAFFRCRVGEGGGAGFRAEEPGGRGVCRAGRGILVFLRQGDGRRCAGESDLWAARRREVAYVRVLRKHANRAVNRGKSSGGTG